MTTKRFKLTPQQLQLVVDDFRICQATDRITVVGERIGCMERRAPINGLDSGWYFRADNESAAYINDATNWGLYHVNTIANYDQDVVPLLDARPGAAFERGPAGVFRPVPGVRPCYSAELGEKGAQVVAGLRAGMSDSSIEVVFVPDS